MKNIFITVVAQFLISLSIAQCPTNVCNPDSAARTELTTTDFKPFNAITHLTVKRFYNIFGPHYSTGVFISPTVILTAGHNTLRSGAKVM